VQAAISLGTLAAAIWVFWRRRDPVLSLCFLVCATFLNTPYAFNYDMVAFGTCVGLAISWRKKPELHRRLLFIATCGLLDAAFGRFPYVFRNDLFFPLLDAVILLGVARDLVVNRNVHKVYRVALPLMIVLQGITIYLWRGSPAWWLEFCQKLLA